MKSPQILAGYAMRKGCKRSHCGTTDARKIRFQAEIAHILIAGKSLDLAENKLPGSAADLASLPTLPNDSEETRGKVLNSETPFFPPSLM